ncbi:FAD binding domain-containing protein [Alicyclobacillus macrosporangiidus]|uniref:FAD binding domain-containing protein n=1 Tax=Alicyclobacillus macrosporangiidus TaxID=392015 RepID=UPI000496F2B4|nr:xanthine dehydrogenase family protein subunit M [Alicyclobacillus macrosporangiidus]
MFPNAFRYEAPATLDEAIRLIAEHAYDAKVLAGGQSLLPMMKLRIAAPAVLIDLGGIGELKGWRETEEGLRIGALARHADLERAAALYGRYPLLSRTARWIADPLVRNRGTIGGSLAHADPASDWGTAMIALHAEVEAAGPEGSRRIPIDDFFVDTFVTSLEEGELVVAVHVPAPSGPVAARYMKLERKAGDFAIAGLAVHIVTDGDGRVAEAGIGICACGPVPLRAAKAEAALVGRPLTNDTIAEASRLVPEDADPADDLRGSSDYKRDLLRVFALRALREIAEELEGRASIA